MRTSAGRPTRFPYADERIYTPPDSPLEDYLHLLGVLGIDRAVLVQPSVYGTDNRALLDALSRRRQGLRGVAVVEPDIATDEVRALDDAGIRGVRFNLVDHKGERNVVPLDVVRTLANTIAPFGWHIEFLVNLDDAPQFAPAIAGLPVDVVVGHLGYPRHGLGPWSNAASLDAFLRLFETGRCWVKLTGPYRISAAPDLPYPDVAPLARRLAGVNPDRLHLGHRLAACHEQEADAERRRPDRSDRRLAARRRLRERVLVANPASALRLCRRREPRRQGAERPQASAYCFACRRRVRCGRRIRGRRRGALLVEAVDLRLLAQLRDQLGLAAAHQEGLDLLTDLVELRHRPVAAVFELDDVPAERRAHRVGHLSRLHLERDIGEFRHHLVLGEVVEVAAVLLAGGVLGQLARDALRSPRPS